MEYPAKMMSQHFNSMLEHLKVSSLINKTRNNQASSSSSNNTTTSNDKESNSLDHTDASVSLNNRSNVIIENHTNDVCEKLQQRLHVSNNPMIGISVNSNNQIQSNGTKVQKTVNVNNDISNSARQVTNNCNSCEKSNNNPLLGSVVVGSTSVNCINVGNSSCPIMGLQQPQQQQRKQSFVIKPIKLKNVITQEETYDTLYTRATEVMPCTKDVCLGSVMLPNIISTEPRKKEVVFAHAKEFIDQYYASIRRSKSPAHITRWQQIQDEIESTGSYQLNETELIYGAKLAWRNSSRCIGRIQWAKLQVFDCRYVTTTSGMFEAICNHIKYATNKGNLRSAITIFPQRTDGSHDYRIWNYQLIQYAGYRNADGSITGDPLTVDVTELCIKLGWRSKRTEWDILPLVVSANGHDPDFFEYPPDLVVEVQITHPTYDWFKDLNLRWYAVPAVSSMLFDCGGIQFTGCAFSGWYMSTEIGCRNLCDTSRRNMLEPVALRMGLDTRNPTSLWKDKALVEVNIAVLHSYQSKNITIVDHHTASESFMKHMENEMKLRKGCPADWVWIVPPMSGSVVPVFHQEMALYYLRPSFEQQDNPMKTHIWEKDGDSSKSKMPRRKFHFKQIARAVKFTSKLFGRALSRRIKATVLYATETGKSEHYAKQLVELLGHAFNAKIYCMDDYDITSIEHEALLMVVASTFGNGDPPENGEAFARELYEMKLQENGASTQHSFSPVSKTFIKVNSRLDLLALKKPLKQIDRLDSLRGSLADSFPSESFGPLSNVRFAVFALGSSAYPNFCSFGKYIDNILEELGGERIMPLTTGDEICGQEQEFRRWAPEVFQIACETFCLDSEDSLNGMTFALQNETLTTNTVRFAKVTESSSLKDALAKFHNREIKVCTAKINPESLHNTNGNERSTISVQIKTEGVAYQPGDHVGIFPENKKELVDGIIERLIGVDDPDEILQLQVLKEDHNPEGIFKTWEKHERLPPCSLRTLLTRFLDITTTPSRKLLQFLATCCDDDKDEEGINRLANDPAVYEDWRYYKTPDLYELLEQFPSCKPPASVLVAQLVPMPARFYSISSSPLKHPNEIHLTVAVVTYKTDNGQGPQHYGVCSNYLASLQKDDSIYLFVRNAVSFHLPKDPELPVILIGPGTGIAPFRGFWQHWHAQKIAGEKIPKVYLFFGCRTKGVDLYREEKATMLQEGVLDRVFLALSREPNIPKTYVQDIAKTESDAIYTLIVKEKGHVYVCGDVTMAEHVYQTLRRIIANKERKSETEVENFMLRLRDENRYHEDIFGITLRTQEIHNKSRATARSRMESQS